MSNVMPEHLQPPAYNVAPSEASRTPSTGGPVIGGSALRSWPSDLTLSILRRVGAVVIAIAAIVVWVTMGSSEKSDGEYLADIRSAMLDDRLNQNSADSAPQQSVVNGWTARDLLAISARIEAQGSRDDDRLAAELMLLCLAVAWFAITSPRYRTVGTYRGAATGA
jgi:hypothetical protein